MHLSKVNQILQEKCNLLPENYTVIGVSGGVDSLTLLDVMAKLKYRIIVAHFDHQLRAESGRDAEFVKNNALKYGFIYFEGTDDVRRFARTQKKSIEEAARILRYKFLINIAQNNSAQAVAVAHNADDQVETVMMHLIRGTGINGLCGMKYWDDTIFPDQPVPIVRPLLGVWRKEIDAHCKENGIIPQEDQTNADIRFTRNRIRHQVLPLLEIGNPKFKEQLFHTSEILKAENELVGQLTIEYRKKVENSQTKSDYSWDETAFLQAPLAIQRRLLYWVLTKYQKNMDAINFDMIAQLLSFFKGSSRSHKVQPVVGLEIYIHRGIIYFYHEAAEDDDGVYPKCGSMNQISCPGVYPLTGRWELLTDFQDNSKNDYMYAGNYECWMDADLLKLPLELRSLKPGDRIQLMGMDGHSKKISDYLTDRHIPVQYRKTWPIFCSGEKIVWVAGSQPAESVRISPLTKKIIHLLIRKVDEDSSKDRA